VIERSLDLYLEAVTGDTSRTNSDDLLKIGQLAKLWWVTVPTIRFWTEKWLLPIAKTTTAWYALYSSDNAKRIQKIKELKEKRYTLKEIGMML